MKIGKWARILLAAAPLLAGCKGFWDAPATTTTTTTSTLSSGIFFVLNQGTHQIAAYSIVSGVLTPATGSPFTVAAAPYSVAISPSGNLMYVGTSLGIYLYSIGSGGALTLANSSSVISSDVATTMQVDSTGAWLLEAGPNLADLIAVPVSPTTGIPSATIEQKIQLPAATVQQLVLSQDNTHIFVALGSAGTEEVVFAAANAAPFGNVTNIPIVNTAGAAVSVAVDPQNRLFYVGETAATSSTNSGGLRVFNYNTLTEVSGSPYATGGLAPYSIAPTNHGTNSGDYVYVANRNVSGNTSGNISGFAITTTGTTYSLTANASTASTGTTPLSLTEDSTGNYLLVVDSGGSPDLEAYIFDTTTAGKLDSTISSSTGTDPVQAVVVAAVQ